MIQLKNTIFILLLSILSSSCTLVTEPDRIQNNQAAPPDYYIFNFDEFPAGKHVDGVIGLFFDPPEISSPVEIVRVFIDDVQRAPLYSFPGLIGIHTRNYEEGNHTITLNVYQKDNNHGLLNLLNAPSKIYETTLYFDRTPPDVVNLSEPVKNSDGIDLNWTESSNDNFVAYLVYKSVNNGTFSLIDTIFDKSSISFTDNSGVELIGTKYQYKIAVTTDRSFEYQTDSNIGLYVLGKPIIYDYSLFVDGPYYSIKKSQLYFIADNKFVSFSSDDNSYLTEIDINDLIVNNSNHVSVNFNNDESRIYIYNPFTNNLWIIDATNLALIKAFSPVEEGEELLVLDNSRIFFSSHDGYKIINTDNNTIENSVSYYQPIAFPVVLNEDNSRLIMSCFINGGAGFKVIDVTNNELNIIDSVQTGSFYTQIKRGGNKLYCNAQWIYDINSLNYLGSLDISGSFYSFAVADNRIAMLLDGNYIIPGFGEVPCKRVVLYNDQIQEIGEWFLFCGIKIATGENTVFTRIDNIIPPGDNILGYTLNTGE